MTICPYKKKTDQEDVSTEKSPCEGTERWGTSAAKQRPQENPNQLTLQSGS